MTVTAGRGQLAKNLVELTASRVAAMGVDWDLCAGDLAVAQRRMAQSGWCFAECEATDPVA